MCDLFKLSDNDTRMTLMTGRFTLHIFTKNVCFFCYIYITLFSSVPMTWNLQLNYK